MTDIKPEDNTVLEGLYKSSGVYCTQCEAEGFRNIVPFLDRPDVMAVWRVRVEADRSTCPVLLSNGNLVASGPVEGSPNRHFTEWEDPFPKPSYLFALVAGDLALTESSFTTRSGKNVALRIWTAARDASKTGWAMESLKRSMAWDERTFGLEYDLSLFNIVAVDSFNMGAMENKSLNVFNSRLVLASTETASDLDYNRIEGVIAHEYFHNYTGNRVTCRDWFQLTLKEGLTVYRDQSFTAEMNSPPVKRIEDVTRLRVSQFGEDAGAWLQRASRGLGWGMGWVRALGCARGGASEGVGIARRGVVVFAHVAWLRAAHTPAAAMQLLQLSPPNRPFTTPSLALVLAGPTAHPIRPDEVGKMVRALGYVAVSQCANCCMPLWAAQRHTVRHVPCVPRYVR